jgi:hypothetical protein
MAPPKGFKLTQEQKDKISKRFKGVPKSPAMRAKLSATKIGTKREPFSEAWRKKISEANKGHIITDEQRKKISAAKKGKSRAPFSEEWRKNISLSNIGRKASPETRAKISEALLGKHHTEKSKRKMSESHKKIPSNRKGIPHTDITKKKMRENHADFSGKNHPQWQGGLSYEPYCPKFNEVFKERVRAFFGYQCQECGHVWQPGEKKLAVHHVNFQKDACCNPQVIPLFIPLCAGKCHTKTNYNRIFWGYWFTEMINRLYGGKCYFTKEEYAALMSVSK